MFTIFRASIEGLRKESGLQFALAEGGDLVPVSASGHAAPAAMMRLGAVVEPQHALFTFAEPNEAEIAVDQQVGG